MNSWMISFRAGMQNMRMFFPFVLVVSHFKHNLIALLYWLLFLGIVTDSVGKRFGISFLFLSPEYQGEISFWSFLLVGFAFGGLNTAFQSYSYIRLGHRFPFLAMVNKPFLKFCLNNTIVPVFFSVVYLKNIVDFQLKEEFASTFDIVSFCVAYCLGFGIFIAISLVYFFPKNKNFFDLLPGFSTKSSVRVNRWSRILFGKSKRYSHSGNHPLYWYFGKSMRIHQCRSTRHYSPQLLQQVFAQNRISTTIFELATVITFILLGLFGNFTVFEVPAAMSVVMLFTIILMLFSSLLSLLKNWIYIVLILILVSMNFLSERYPVFHYENHARGLNYIENNAYNFMILDSLNNDRITQKQDSLAYINLLNAWKLNTGEEKPLMVILNTSGGGSRSASWVFEVMRYCDSISENHFFKNTAFISGASGGMVGAAYYRALKKEQIEGSEIDFNKSKYAQAISADLLNKLCFTASTNDLFFRFQSKLMDENKLGYDRGISFEQALNENTKGLFDHPISDYRALEKQGKLPVMVFSPMIVNDGRRLMISSQKLSFINSHIANMPGNSRANENIDFHQLLAKSHPDQIRFSSVLRMQATFPYVLPMVSLPTTPTLQVMDAGARDNFGTKTTLQWMFALRKWIKENTSGVLVVQIRDTKTILSGEEVEQSSFFSKLIQPFGNVFSNFPRTQDFDHEEFWKMASFQKDFPMSLVSINLREFSNDRISLSWHLTQREKLKIKRAIRSEENQRSIRNITSSINKRK